MKTTRLLTALLLCLAALAACTTTGTGGGQVTGAGAQEEPVAFNWKSTDGGMSGGGEGECQLSDGRVVRAVFPGK